MEVMTCGTDQKADARKLSSTFMAGSWAQHGYRMAPDGSALVLPLEDGFEVVRGGEKWKHEFPLMSSIDRDLFWAPDSKRFVFRVPDENLSLGLVDLSDPTKHKVIYAPPAGSTIRGFEWSPRNDLVFVLEGFEDRDKDGKQEEGDRIKAVDPSTAKAREIYCSPATLSFFMPPVSRFQGGQGPSTKDYRLVLGTASGLFTVRPDGSQLTCLSELPCTGLTNLEWSPTDEKLVLFFRIPTKSKKGMLKGTYLVHLDRRKKDQPPGAADESIFEQLSPALDVHTLWFSPRGKYVAWASQDAVWYREPQGGAVVKVECRDEKGRALNVRGCAWDQGEQRLAITAGNRLYVHEAAKRGEAKRAPALRLVKEFENDQGDSNFAAEPTWVGDELVLTVFNSIGKKNAPPKK